MTSLITRLFVFELPDGTRGIAPASDQGVLKANVSAELSIDINDVFVIGLAEDVLNEDCSGMVFVSKVSQSRRIVVSKCSECPNAGHMGGFGKVAYIPRCEKVGKELPWFPSASRTGRVTAAMSDEIPDWCPLSRS